MAKDFTGGMLESIKELVDYQEQKPGDMQYDHWRKSEIFSELFVAASRELLARGEVIDALRAARAAMFKVAQTDDFAEVRQNQKTIIKAVIDNHDITQPDLAPVLMKHLLESNIWTTRDSPIAQKQWRECMEQILKTRNSGLVTQILTQARDFLPHATGTAHRFQGMIEEFTKKAAKLHAPQR
jgi:hypothetical protein